MDHELHMARVSATEAAGICVEKTKQVQRVLEAVEAKEAKLDRALDILEVNRRIEEVDNTIANQLFHELRVEMQALKRELQQDILRQAQGILILGAQIQAHVHLKAPPAVEAD